MDDPVVTGRYCSNCGNVLKDIYCEKCGQKKVKLEDKTVKAFVLHFVEEFFTFDSKFLRTVKYLFLKPGYLTLEYISGRFVRYVTPIKLYLFTSLISIFILISLDPDQYTSLMEPENKDDFIQETINTIKETKNVTETEFKDNFNQFVNNNTSISLFFVMLAFSIILKVTYFNKHIYYVEHLVFTLHFFSMVLIMFVTGSILSKLVNEMNDLFLFFLPPVYLFFSVKRVYHTKWLNSVIPAMFLTFVYWVLLASWALGLIFLASLMA